MINNQDTNSESHIIHKSFKCRIYPNKEQEAYFINHFNACRLVWNTFLNLHQKDKSLKINHFADEKLFRQLKKDGITFKKTEFCDISKCSAHTFYSTIEYLDKVAYKKFFKKQAGYPKFKNRFDAQSVTFPDGVSIVNGNYNNKYCYLKFPKINSLIKIKLPESNNIKKLAQVIVTKTKSNKYFVSLSCEVPCNYLSKNSNAIGIDLGIKDLIVCSNGETFSNPKFYDKKLKHLKFLQRQLAKKQKGSHNRDKAKKKLALVYEKITNAKQNNIHQMTSKIIKNNQLICAESLNVASMITDASKEKKHSLARNISNANMSEILRQLSYKSDWYGRNFVQIPRFFASSQICHHCGYQNKDLKLDDRKWICPQCGKEVNRDFNAAQNILDCGITEFNKSGGSWSSDSKQKDVEAFSLEKPLA